LQKEENKFQFLLQLSNDGSGIGAALTVAAEVLAAGDAKKSDSKRTDL
jgi:hypothetical protein